MKRLLRKYQSLSLPVKASMWYVVCSVLQKGISLVTTPIFTRILSTEEYGTISLYNSWDSILTIFATLYLYQGVYNNGMVKYKQNRDQYNVSMQTTTSVLTILLGLVYICNTKFWNGILGLNTQLVIMMLTSIFFTAAVSFWSIRNRYEFKYKPVVSLTLITSVLAAILGIVFVLNGQGRAEEKIFGTVIVQVVFYGIIYIINIIHGKCLVKREYVKYALSFNIPLLPHYLSTVILNQSDRIMINYFNGKSAAGIYGLAYQGAMLMTIFTTSINNSFAPWMYGEMDRKDYSKIGKSAIQIIIIVGIMCTAVALFAPEMIAILGSSAYADAVWVVPPVAMSVLFIFVYCCFANIEFFYEKKKMILVGSIFSAVTNIVLNLIFIPIFGFVAAGYTTLASYILFTIFHYFSMKITCKENNVNNPYNGKLIVIICAAFVLASLACNLLYLNSVVRYSVILVAAVLCVILFIKYRSTIIQVLSKKRG